MSVQQQQIRIIPENFPFQIQKELSVLDSQIKKLGKLISKNEAYQSQLKKMVKLIDLRIARKKQELEQIQIENKLSSNYSIYNNHLVANISFYKFDTNSQGNEYLKTIQWANINQKKSKMVSIFKNIKFNSISTVKNLDIGQLQIQQTSPKLSFKVSPNKNNFNNSIEKNSLSKDLNQSDFRNSFYYNSHCKNEENVEVIDEGSIKNKIKKEYFSHDDNENDSITKSPIQYQLKPIRLQFYSGNQLFSNLKASLDKDSVLKDNSELCKVSDEQNQHSVKKNSFIIAFVGKLDKDPKSVDWIQQAELCEAYAQKKNIIFSKQQQQQENKITALDLYQAYITLNNLRKNTSPWTPEEDRQIKQVVELYGEDNWVQVANHLDGRDSTEIQLRYQKIIKSQISYGKWFLRDDVKLLVLIEIFGQKWCDIEKYLTTKTQIQARERWFNLLNPQLKNLTWTKQEDLNLLQLANKYDGKWSKICTFFSEQNPKTDNQCYRRWKQLIKSRGNFNPEQQKRIKSRIQKKQPLFFIVNSERLRPFLMKDLMKISKQKEKNAKHRAQKNKLKPKQKVLSFQQQQQIISQLQPSLSDISEQNPSQKSQ